MDKSLEKEINTLVQKKLKKFKYAISVLTIILVIISALNLFNIYQNKKIINQEKTFISNIQEIITSLEK